MKFISHRGNLNGPDIAAENDLVHLINVLKTTPYDIEIDVWLLDSLILLNHDLTNKPKMTFNEFDSKFSLYKDRLWIHCKNIESLTFFLKTDYHCFGHSEDSFTLTSRMQIFTKPGIVTSDSITVMPELVYSQVENSIFDCKGILTDYPIKYEAYYNSIRTQ